MMIAKIAIEKQQLVNSNWQLTRTLNYSGRHSLISAEISDRNARSFAADFRG